MSFVSGSRRVYRGGGWGGVPLYARVAFRSSRTPDGRDYVLGVRLMRRYT